MKNVVLFIIAVSQLIGCSNQNESAKPVPREDKTGEISNGQESRVKSTETTSSEENDKEVKSAAKEDVEDSGQTGLSSEIHEGLVKLPSFNTHRWNKEMNPRANPNSVFFVYIDDRDPVKVSRSDSGAVYNLELGKKHIVRVILDGKLYGSFKFTFERYKCNSLVLKYKADHGPWVINRDDKNCKTSPVNPAFTHPNIWRCGTCCPRARGCAGS